jgi:plasmid stabilization system protein ParE
VANRYRLSNKARAGLYKIWADVAVENATAADSLYLRIIGKLESAAMHSGIGSPRPEFGDGARMLVEGNYKMIYVPDKGGIIVTAIVHSKRHPANW